jgi:hypothetical protein
MIKANPYLEYSEDLEAAGSLADVIAANPDPLQRLIELDILQKHLQELRVKAEDEAVPILEERWKKIHPELLDRRFLVASHKVTFIVDGKEDEWRYTFHPPAQKARVEREAIEKAMRRAALGRPSDAPPAQRKLGRLSVEVNLLGPKR